MSIPTVRFDILSDKSKGAHYSKEVANLASACSDWGFVYLTNMDKQKEFDRMIQAARAFFTMPLDSKMKLATQKVCSENKNKYRGYFPLVEKSHSYKEGFEIGWQNYKLTGSGCIFDEPSVLPETAPEQDWLEAINNYFDLQLDIGTVVLEAFESHFELESGYFTEKFKNTLSTLRLLHYPALTDSIDTSKLEQDGGVVFTTPKHTDSGIVTLLLQDENGGLQVLRSAGNWVDAPPLHDSMVMNIGDLLERWTGGEFKATQHRLKAPSRSRYSIPLFFEPEGKALIEPFKENDQFKPVTYEKYLEKKFLEFIEYQAVPQ